MISGVLVLLEASLLMKGSPVQMVSFQMVARTKRNAQPRVDDRSDEIAGSSSYGYTVLACKACSDYRVESS